MLGRSAIVCWEKKPTVTGQYGRVVRSAHAVRSARIIDSMGRGAVHLTAFGATWYVMYLARDAMGARGWVCKVRQTLIKAMLEGAITYLDWFLLLRDLTQHLCRS